MKYEMAQTNNKICMYFRIYRFKSVIMSENLENEIQSCKCKKLHGPISPRDLDLATFLAKSGT